MTSDEALEEYRTAEREAMEADDPRLAARVLRRIYYQLGLRGDTAGAHDALEQAIALVEHDDGAQEVLAELGAVGWPKTTGSKGIHVYVRIAPEHGFRDVRRAALAFAREVERRTEEATTTWWRPDCSGSGIAALVQLCNGGSGPKPGRSTPWWTSWPSRPSPSEHKL